MRGALFRTACASLALAAAAACAATGAEESTPPAPTEDGGKLPPDASTQDDAAASDAADAPDVAIEDPQCSADGWCVTTLPDKNLKLVDVWPLADRSFALAESPSRGVKVLEWDSSTNAWSYIDDTTQNGFPGVETSIWAPNANEVYFAISDTGTPGAYVYRGTRPVAPATTWTWTRLRFDCNRTDASPQVWGTSADDVYVLTCGAIHHLTSFDPAHPPPGPDYLDDDTEHPLELLGAAGTTADDLWFVGTRGWTPGQCTVVVRKTAAGYQRIVDGIPHTDFYRCNPKDDYPTIGGAFRSGVLSPAKGRLIGLRYSDSAGNDLVRITANTDGSYALASSRPPVAMAVNLRSFWGVAEDDLWLVSTRGGGGSVLRGTNVWSDAGAYRYSTLALSTAPNFQPLHRIRGTSNTNLWAVGDDRVFHKTTP